MAKINSINNKTESLTIDPGASGDSYTQYQIATTDKFRIGSDDDASDSFKISSGNALGANDTFIMTTAGERTMPLQPCFMASLASDISNVTGNNTLYTVVWDTENFDQNNDFDGTSTFTAPVTGRYYFVANVLLDQLTSSYTLGAIRLTTTSYTYQGNLLNPGAACDSAGKLSLSFSGIVPMTATNTATVSVVVGNSTKVIDVLGSTSQSAVVSYFAGYLVC